MVRRLFSRCFWLHRADRRAGRLCPCWKELGAIAEAAQAGLFRAPASSSARVGDWPSPWVDMGRTLDAGEADDV